MFRDRSCGSYRPGHLMHWIQMKKSREDDQPIIPVKVVAVQDDGRVDIDSSDGELTLWFHEPSRIRSVVEQCARWKPKYHVLETSSHGSFNMATLDEHESCIRARKVDLTYLSAVEEVTCDAVAGYQPEPAK